MQSLAGEHVSRGAPDETVPPADYWNAKVGKWGVYAMFLACLAKLVQAEAAVERGYWAQKRLMNHLRNRLQNDSIRDEMRILLNGGPFSRYCHCWIAVGAFAGIRDPQGVTVQPKEILSGPPCPSDPTNSEA